jgi:hypothetical protein
MLRVVLASAALALFVLSLLLPWGGSAVGWSVMVEMSTQVWGVRVDEVVLFFPLLLSSAALLIIPILMLTALKDRKIWTLIPVCLILLCGHAIWVLIGKVFSFPNGFFIWMSALAALTVCTTSARYTWHRENRKF